MSSGANPNDEIRRVMLQYFYDRNANATSKFGKKGSAIKISDVKKELKAGHGLTQQQVQSNLNYLIDRDWVKSVGQEKTVTTRRGTTVPSVVTFFEITAQGIDRIEGGSEFEPRERYPGIKIEATGRNVITLGDGNVVNVEYQQLFDELTQLKEGITSSSELSEQEKLDVAIDIETLKDQLAKDQPDEEIARRLWPRIEKAANIAGLAGAALQVGQAISHLL
jgi:hypothetical protein